jgi:hypothetical protein
MQEADRLAAAPKKTLVFVLVSATAPREDGRTASEQESLRRIIAPLYSY